MGEESGREVREGKNEGGGRMREKKEEMVRKGKGREGRSGEGREGKQGRVEEERRERR